MLLVTQKHKLKCKPGSKAQAKFSKNLSGIKKKKSLDPRAAALKLTSDA